MTPTPYRGKRNDSSYLVYVVEKMSEIRGISVEEMESVTWKNACELFKLGG
jgi:TatD DNase family protein